MNEESMRHLVAIDIGSNSMHLVIAREQDNSLQILHKEKQSVQLGLGLDANNVLSMDAIDRGVKCLANFNQRFSNLPKAQVKIVATQTLRIATNSQQFVDEAHKYLNYPIDIISGNEEARLIYSGVSHTQKLKDLNVVIDIGGGSTEIILGIGNAPMHLASLACGCVSYKNIFFPNGELTKEAFKKAQKAASNLLETLPKEIIECKIKPNFLGCSGTIKAISAALFEIFDDNTITISRLNKLKQYLIDCKHVDKIDLSLLETKRINVLAPGLAILLSFCKQQNVSKLHFASGALREGVLYEIAAIDKDLNISDRTIISMSKLYHIDSIHANKVKKTILALLKKISPTWDITQYKDLLLNAAKLHEIGIHINFKGHPKHGQYIINNSNMPGFTPIQQENIAWLIANQKKKPDLSELTEYPQDEKIVLARLLAILRLAILFNLGRFPRNLLFDHIKVYENKIVLNLPEHRSTDLIKEDLTQEKNFLDELGIELSF